MLNAVIVWMPRNRFRLRVLADGEEGEKGIFFFFFAKVISPTEFLPGEVGVQSHQ